jgi:hypothetical protein
MSGTILEIRIYESLISIVHNHTKDGGIPIILQMQEEARLLLLLQRPAALSTTVQLYV